jgi:ligand-binding sensor domain-containing protein
MGTLLGLTRFDGINFKVYTRKEGLAENWITAIATDKNDDLWIGTASGGVSKLHFK